MAGQQEPKAGGRTTTLMGKQRVVDASQRSALSPFYTAQESPAQGMVSISISVNLMEVIPPRHAQTPLFSVILDLVDDEPSTHPRSSIIITT